MIPPHNLEDEYAVLGSMMIDKEAADKGVAMLQPEDFFEPSNAAVFRIVAKLVSIGKPVDVMSVGSEIKSQNLPQDYGAILINMVTIVTTSLHVDYYIEQIKNYSILRAAISKFGEVIRDCYEHSKPSQEILEKAEKYLYGLSAWKVTGLRHVKETIHEHLEAMEKKQRVGTQVGGIAVGLPTIDRVTNGLQTSNMIVLAARPSVGKTAMAVDIARRAIKNGVITAFFSIEQSYSEIMNRFISGMTNIPLMDLLHGTYKDQDYDAIMSAGAELTESPLYTVCSDCHSVSMVRAMCRKLGTSLALQGKSLGLIVVDYLQLLDGGGRNYENRQNEVSEISRSLKRIAKDMNVAVLALSQLNRNPEGRANGRPLLSDLRESGSIEQDADLVMMMWREENCTKLEIQKHRNGPLANVSLFFKKEIASFVEMDKQEAE